MHRFSLLAVLATLGLVVTGAWITSQHPATNVWLSVHVTLAVVLAVLLIAVAVAGRKHRPVVWLGLIALAVVVMEAPLGEHAAYMWHSVWHATMAAVLLALTTAVALCTSTGWKSGPETVFDSGWPSLRSLAVVAPTLVFIQVLLGACF